MSATDLTAQLTEWVTEAIDGAAMGETFPFTVVSGDMQVPGGTLPAWAVYVMTASPLLGTPPLTVRLNIPVLVMASGNQDAVRQNVHQAMGTLRQQFTATLQSLKNGPAPAMPLPPGPLGKN